MEKVYAVLTGDLVKSSLLTSKQLIAVRKCLQSAAIELNRWKPRMISGKIDFFRGDAWQLLLNDPRWALRVAMYLRATLQAKYNADTRVAIGIGPIREKTRGRVSLSTGTAFTLSGMALDGLDGRHRMGIAFSNYVDIEYWLPLIVILCDKLIQTWTRRQAQIVRMAMLGDSRTEIARRLNPPTTQPSVTQVLRRADWPVLEEILERFEMVYESV